MFGIAKLATKSDEPRLVKSLALPKISLFSPKEIRAMDRRRFVPAAEGLEVRTMLATTGSRLQPLWLELEHDPDPAHHLPAERAADPEDANQSPCVAA